ncbi:MAG: AAA domain-containing protein, partial [Armatimonadia bacterium]|nr:AAA domain-containing protein [Armatimonadia bacterium]
APERLKRLLETNRLVVTGNPMLVGDALPAQDPLPGLDGEGLKRLRASLDQLLGARHNAPGEAIESAGADGSPLTERLAAQVLSLCSRTPRVIRDDIRVLGLQRLGMLLGAGARWAGLADSYEPLNAAYEEMRRESGRVLRDALAADLLLCRLAELREPAAWKIAIGLSETRSEAEAIARRCLEGGFAAIAPEDADDPNISRLRSLVPGDCVIMHLRGRLGAIGRVTRPYYEIDRAEAGPLDRCWWRRVGVEWVPGDRDYGSLLAGAHQRYSVIELEPECFRAISRMYLRDPDYDRLFRPLHGSWMVRCDDSRREALTSLDKPLPLRDQWSLALGERRPAPGDRIFLYHDSSPRGVFGAATVISDPHRDPRSESGGYRLELIYERLREGPIPARVMASDPRLSDWQAPSEQVRHIPPEQTAALSERMGLSGLRHFVLLSKGAPGNIVHTQETYHVRGRASATTARLASATREGLARCLIYHTAPENAFVGFGRVAEVREPDGSGRGECDEGSAERERGAEVSLEICRFARKAGGWSIGAREEADGSGRGRGSDGHTRTILPVSEHDFYRVVGAGMAGPARAEQVVSLQALADESGAPVERLEEMARLLRDRGQMILYGPPGTGKTWLALRLASWLSDGDETRREIVQFHPAYSYEDFIEGIRPQAVERSDGSTAVDYPLVRGSFASFCDRARRDAYNTHVFLIDEINRAQVAAVFGELMLALEYRGREVRLAHARAQGAGGSSLVVPPNVLVLGTMNTADRSTALVDHALRRRFAFYPLFPDDPELVRPMFEGWLDEHAPGARWVAHLLRELNEWLEPEVGRHLLVGHSYFMRPGLDEQVVREVWRFQIEPLLEEYFAGVPERLAELELDELIARARERAEGRTPERAEAPVGDGRLWWGGEEDG